MAHPGAFLDEAQNDATLLAIRAQEDAGLDIVTDGEIRRESYSNRFATALDGVDLDNPGTALDRSGHPNPVPRIVGRIRRASCRRGRRPEVPEGAHDAQDEDHRARPFTMSQQAQNDFYKSDEDAAMDYAEAVNAEIKDLFAAGADVVQIDEPYMQARPEKARQYGLNALNRALEGVTGTTCVHICFGYAAIIHERPSGLFVPAGAGGVQLQPGLDRNRAVEARLRGAARTARQADSAGHDRSVGHERRDARNRRGAHSPRAAVTSPENIIVATDCGMKYLPRDVAFGKLRALVKGAEIMRRELGRS